MKATHRCLRWCSVERQCKERIVYILFYFNSKCLCSHAGRICSAVEVKFPPGKMGHPERSPTVELKRHWTMRFLSGVCLHIYKVSRPSVSTQDTRGLRTLRPQQIMNSRSLSSLKQVARTLGISHMHEKYRFPKGFTGRVSGALKVLDHWICVYRRASGGAQFGSYL